MRKRKWKWEEWVLINKGTSKTEKEWKYWRDEIRTNKKGENNSGYAWSRHVS